MRLKRIIQLGADQATISLYQQLVAEHGTPLLVFDSNVLREQFLQLQTALPNVELFYAVKAHPAIEIIRQIDELCQEFGGGFDVASHGEMSMLLDQGITGRRAIHTHPIKKPQEIKDALRFGATTFVVDNIEELKKLLPYRSRIGVLLRVAFRGNAVVDLSKKFGCGISEAKDIVLQAAKLGIHIKGLSFHVGSQCANAQKHVEAINVCADLIEQLNREIDKPMSMLDIGGGFPADYALEGNSINDFCAPIRQELAKLPPDWHLIAEPGRFLVAPSITSVASIIGKAKKQDTFWYYLDDGVYGSYSGQIFDHAVYPLQVLKSSETLYNSVLSGPTCDSIDTVAENIRLPELQIGDLILGHQMGAYTAATKTRFNSLPEAKLIEIGAN